MRLRTLGRHWVDAAGKLSLISLGVSRPPGAISKPRLANKANYTIFRR